jgi:hypothetical protein
MHALVSPNEKVFDSTGNALGDRVAEVTANEFPVADPLFWVECDDSVIADQFYWLNEQILPIPAPPPPVLLDGDGPAVL